MPLQGRRWTGRSTRVARATLLLAWLATAPALAAGDDAAARAAVALGETLFSDPRLSADGRTSCASCHQPARAFTDGKAAAEGAMRRRGTRNTPSLLDVAARRDLMWDGRSVSLEAQVLLPFTQEREHGLSSVDAVTRVVDADARYASLFAQAFGGRRADREGIATALSAFLRSLATTGSAYDAFVAGDTGALSDAALRGYVLFRGQAGCAQCHRLDAQRATFTDGAFHRVGVGLSGVNARLAELTAQVESSSPTMLDALIFDDRDVAALGRYLVTRNPRDIGAYRTPSLRNVAVTGPYMHDGSVATLADAVNVELYYRRAVPGRSAALSVRDQADLVEFLHALTDSRYQALPEHLDKQATTGR